MTVRHNPHPTFTLLQVGQLALFFHDHFCILIYYEDGSSDSPTDSDAIAEGYIVDFREGLLELKDDHGTTMPVPWQQILGIEILAHRDVFGE